MQQLVVLTSALQPLPDERFLTMSLVYNSSTPLGEPSAFCKRFADPFCLCGAKYKGYTPFGFCDADISALPRFSGDVLDLPVGEVRTDEHSIVIKVTQPDSEAPGIEVSLKHRGVASHAA